MGATLIYFLLQHKAELGIKHITSVTIFRDTYDDDFQARVMLLFGIEDVPTPMEGITVHDAQVSNIRCSVDVTHSGETIVRVHKSMASAVRPGRSR